LKKIVVVSIFLFSFSSLNTGPSGEVTEVYIPVVSQQYDFRAKLISDFQKKQQKIFRQKSNIKDFTLTQMKKYGWGTSEYKCLYSLWKKESNWRWNAHNKISNAYGIAQATPGWKMRHAWAGGGADWKTNPRTQINWGLAYIKRSKHKTPCGAWEYSVKNNWY
jgi:hypothetical protein